MKPLKYDSGKVMKLSTVEDTTIVKGDALEFASGYVQRADSGTTEVRFIALEGKVTASGDHEDILVLYVEGVEIEADTNGNTSQALIGTFIDLTDHDTLNEAASSTDVFYVTKLVGAVANKKVRGFFVPKNS